MLILPIGDINPRRTVPYVNYLLIAVNTAVFILLGFQENYDLIVSRYGLTPAQIKPLTFITSMFLHGSIFHLVGNMLFLWICGDNVEDRLGHLGFLLLYLTAGLVAGGAHILMISPAEKMIPCIGASGAISGIMGAYLVLFPGSRIKFWYFFFFYFFIRTGTFMLTSFWAIGFWFAEQLLLTFISSAYQMPSGVAYWAHIGGFVFAFIIVLLIRSTGIVQGGLRKKHY
ncbi:MAG: rhomboid family intramembrane serine protease [Planctomycetota bacterium]